MCSSIQSRSVKQDVENSKLLCDCYVFESESDMRRSLSRLCYGNLFVIGTVGMEALKSVLLGSKMSLVPVVKAAPETEKNEPEKPKPMKLTELPLDEAPHSVYNTFQWEQHRCSGLQKKMMEESLLPCVSEIRTATQKSIIDFGSCLQQTYKDIADVIDSTKNQILAICRDDNYLCYREVALGSAAVAGFLLPSRKYWLLTRKLFGASGAACAVGAVCFPKETDQAIRTVSYHSAKLVIACYNFYSSSNVAMKPELPCSSVIPEMPKPKPDICGEERAKKQAEMDAITKPKKT